MNGCRWIKTEKVTSAEKKINFLLTPKTLLYSVDRCSVQKPLNGLVFGFDNSGFFGNSFWFFFYFFSFFLNLILVFQFNLKYDPKQISCCLKSEQLSRCYKNKKKKITYHSMFIVINFSKWNIVIFFPSNLNKINEKILVI